MMHSPMFPTNLTLATTDPAAASDSLNLLEDSFAAFLRQPRNRSLISPRPLYNPSPRLPSALPPSASPRKFEPLTPDRSQPVIPFFNDSDVSDLAPPSPKEIERAAERERRIQWAKSQPLLPRMGLDELGVVDEDVADTMFNNMRRAVPQQRQQQHQPTIPSTNLPIPSTIQPNRVDSNPVPNMPHPAMKLELGILGNANRPVLSPRAWGVTGEGIGGGSGWGKDILGSFAGQKRGETRTAPVITSRMGQKQHQHVEKEERVRVRSVPVVRGRIGMDLVTNGITTTGTSGRKGRRMIKVVGGDPLKCHLCGQRFARRSNLFKHLRSVHEEVRKFACNQCSFKFKRQDHLLKHTRSVHNKVRKFQCEICGIGFAEKFNRDKHTRSIHYTKRAFQCACGAYFQDRDKMMACLRCKRLPQTFHQTAAL